MKFFGLALLGALAGGVSAELEERGLYEIVKKAVEKPSPSPSASSIADAQPSPPKATISPPKPSWHSIIMPTRPANQTGVWPTGTGSPWPTGTGRARTTHKVTVGAQGKNVFQPNSVRANIGDVVQFDFLGRNHTVSQSDFATPCIYNGGFDSGFQPNPRNQSGLFIRSYVVKSQKPTWFYCKQTGHCPQGMVFGINPGMKMYEFIVNARLGGNSTRPVNGTAGVGTVVVTKVSTIRSTVQGKPSTTTVNVVSTVLGSVTTIPSTSVTTLPGSVVTRTSTIRTTITTLPIPTLRPTTRTIVLTKTITSLTTVDGTVSTKLVTSLATTRVTIKPTVAPTVTGQPIITKQTIRTTVVTKLTTVITTVHGSPTTKLTTTTTTKRITKPTIKPITIVNPGGSSSGGTRRRVKVTLTRNKKVRFSPRFLLDQNNGDTIRFDVRASDYTLYESSFDQPCKKLPGSKIDSDFLKVKKGKRGARVFDMKLGSDCEKPRYFFLKANNDKSDKCSRDMVFIVNPKSPRQFHEFFWKAGGKGKGKGKGGMDNKAPKV
ncbi:MAG: hypothetical protein M1823_000692 [Watsoniomyces obsoletus]|nr:MAG: hypothetical protein M1823_000692 [Watsoniomyces obsoletus]